MTSYGMPTLTEMYLRARVYAELTFLRVIATLLYMELCVIRLFDLLMILRRAQR